MAFITNTVQRIPILVPYLSQAKKNGKVSQPFRLHLSISHETNTSLTSVEIALYL